MHYLDVWGSSKDSLTGAGTYKLTRKDLSKTPLSDFGRNRIPERMLAWMGGARSKLKAKRKKGMRADNTFLLHKITCKEECIAMDAMDRYQC